MSVATHIFANGIRVEASLLIPAQIARYAGTNLHEPEEEAWFHRVLEGCADQPVRFWDIGAGVGYYSMLVARICPAAQVTAFEPLPDHAAAIGRHWALNGLDPALLTLRQAAVSDTPGEATFVVNDFSSHLATGPVTARASLPVRLVTLQQELSRGTDRIDLVKVDVQGAEEAVLRGAGAAARLIRTWIVGTHGPQCHLAVERAFQALGADLMCSEAVVPGQPDGLVVARFAG